MQVIKTSEGFELTYKIPEMDKELVTNVVIHFNRQVEINPRNWIGKDMCKEQSQEELKLIAETLLYISNMKFSTGGNIV